MSEHPVSPWYGNQTIAPNDHSGRGDEYGKPPRETPPDGFTPDDIAASAEAANAGTKPNLTGLTASRRSPSGLNIKFREDLDAARAESDAKVAAFDQSEYNVTAQRADPKRGCTLPETVLRGEQHDAYVAFRAAAADIEAAQEALNAKSAAFRAALARLTKAATTS